MSRHALERLCGICGVTPRRIAPTLRRLGPFVEQSIPDHYDPDAIQVLLAIAGKAVMDWQRTYRRALECKGWLEPAVTVTADPRPARRRRPRPQLQRTSKEVLRLRRLAGLRRRSIAYWKRRFEEVREKSKGTDIRWKRVSRAPRFRARVTLIVFFRCHPVSSYAFPS